MGLYQLITYIETTKGRILFASTMGLYQLITYIETYPINNELAFSRRHFLSRNTFIYHFYFCRQSKTTHIITS